MALSELKKYLTTLEKDQLIEVVTNLYKSNKSVKEYFNFTINPDPTATFKIYDDKVYHAFFPKRGNQLKLKDAQKAISDFKKLNPQPTHLAELLMRYVESGVFFERQFGDISDSFYSTGIKHFEQALLLLSQENRLGDFSGRINEIVKNSQKVGFDFPDDIKEVYQKYFKKSKKEKDD